jgi:hypothetical protein
MVSLSDSEILFDIPEGQLPFVTATIQLDIQFDRFGGVA